eukprot:80674-Rhodomonas_salina.1
MLRSAFRAQAVLVVRYAGFLRVLLPAFSLSSFFPFVSSSSFSCGSGRFPICVYGRARVCAHLFRAT